MKALWIALTAAVATFLARRGRRTKSPAEAVPAVGTAEADAATLRALRDAGADLTKETEVNFYLYFPTREAAQRAAEQARTPSFTATVRKGALGDSWLCFVTAQMVPSESAIRSAATRLQAVAASNGGEYDGWEAAVRQ